MPYSEHSSFDQLQSLVRELKPKRLVPTVNSESREGRERMMAPFLDVLDLKADPNRMDHYLQRDSQSEAEMVDVLSLSRPTWSLRPAKVELSLEEDDCEMTTCEASCVECEDLRNVDLEQQKRLLRFFESSAPKLAASKGLKKPKKPKGKGKGKGKQSLD